MKAAQLVTGKTYEDKKGQYHRTINKIDNGVVHFEDGGQKNHCRAQEFAAWAARPSGARKPKKDKEQ